jgi:hypothetical protein
MQKAINVSDEFGVDLGTGLWSMKKVDLLKANLSTDFGIDSGTGKWTLLNVDMSKATNLSSQFKKVGTTQTVDNLDAKLLVTGYLQIGGGTNRVACAKFFDTSVVPKLFGFVGDDRVTTDNPSGSGYIGAWFNLIGIGGAGPLTPNFYCDGSGNVIAKSIQIADAGGSAGFINSTGSWVKRLGVGGTSGAPNFFSDSSGNVVAASILLADATGTKGYIGEISWFKRVLIGGPDAAHPKISADVNGNVTIDGSLIVGTLPSATTAGTATSAGYATNSGVAAVFNGTILVTQIGNGTLPVGVVYAGTINCSQLNGGTINASITLTRQR